MFILDNTIKQYILPMMKSNKYLIFMFICKQELYIALKIKSTFINCKTKLLV